MKAKKLLTLIFPALMLLSLASCSEENNNKTSNSRPNTNISNSSSVVVNTSSATNKESSPIANENIALTEENIIGAWELLSLIDGDVTYNLGDEYWGEILTPKLMIMDFQAGGKGVYTLTFSDDQSHELSISWKIEDNKLTFIIDNDAHGVATLENGILVAYSIDECITYNYVRKSN